jgi:hypothetical protein
MKELHDERLDIPVLSVCSVVCDVQMIEVIRKESMVTALDPMRLDFILTEIVNLKKLNRKLLSNKYGIPKRCRHPSQRNCLHVLGKILLGRNKSLRGSPIVA